MLLVSIFAGGLIGDCIGDLDSRDLVALSVSRSTTQSSSSASSSISLFYLTNSSNLYSIVSLSDFPYVSVRHQEKPQATIPNTAGTNQLLRDMLAAMLLAKGETMLPTIPTKLTHPNPKLLTSVGYNSAV
jgi:hypothetical protein